PLPDLLRMLRGKVRRPGGGNFFYDLRSEGQGLGRRMKVLDLLKAYRKNRPPHERFGIGPLAIIPKTFQNP
ncbi:MAG TPA: hypothetical protein VF711_06805, partial [Acidimicrobiales bacterium]